MLMEKLEKLGFTHNESLIYSYLVTIGICTAGRLIKETGLHRNIVYDNLERLVDKGLATFIIKDGVKHFSATTPEAIDDMIEKELKDLEKRKKLVFDLKSEMANALSNQKESPEAVLYRGKAGVKRVLKDAIIEGKDYVVLGAPLVSVDIMSEQYWKNYNRLQNKKGIRRRMIFNEDLRAYGKKLETYLTKIRYMAREINPLTETVIYGDNVAIIIWSSNPVTIFIRDKFVAQAYRNYFEVLWKTAKK